MIRAGSGLALPDDSDTHKQRLWDKAVVDAEFSQLYNKYTDPHHRARPLAAVAHHSGDWLHTVPNPDQCLDDSAIRVAVGLRLDSSAVHSARFTSVHAVPQRTLSVCMP